jgi:hypothetical protein
MSANVEQDAARYILRWSSLKSICSSICSSSAYISASKQWFSSSTHVKVPIRVSTAHQWATLSRVLTSGTTSSRCFLPYDLIGTHYCCCKRSRSISNPVPTCNRSHSITSPAVSRVRTLRRSFSRWCLISPFCPSIEWSGSCRTGTMTPWSDAARASEGFRVLARVAASCSLGDICGKGAVFAMRSRALKGILSATAPFVCGLVEGGDGYLDRVLATLPLCHL